MELARQPTGETALDAAIDAATVVLVGKQNVDGFWVAAADSGPASTAQVVLALHHLGALTPTVARGAVAFLRARQRSDGGYPRFPFAVESDLDATAHAWAALRAIGAEEDRSAAARARLFVQDHGGLPAVRGGLERGDLGALSLVLADILPPSALPVPRLALLLLPGVERVVLSHVHGGILMNAHGLSAIARPLTADSGWFDQKIYRCARTLYEAFQNQDGSWNGWTVPTAIAALALQALGLRRDDDRIARATAWLHQQAITDGAELWFPAFRLPVWCTTFDTSALLRSSLPGAPLSPAALAAIDWLLTAQARRPQAQVNNPRAGALRIGGWPFTPGNDTMPDCDDTAAALGVLGQAAAVLTENRPGNWALASRLAAAMDRGQQWLIGMQNPDGGWSSYVQGLPGKPRGPIMMQPVRVPLSDPRGWLALLRAPPLALGDPSTEDVTGRALHGLGLVGQTTDFPHVQRAIAFLRSMQCDCGAFWGRWLTNYLSGTSFVLLGLAAVKADLAAPWVARAIGWLLQRQRSDGAWGETVASYRDPDLAGVGPPSPPLTGLVASALIAVDMGRSPAVARAIAFLLAAQRADGTWSDADYLAPLVPPDTFYSYPEVASHYPLEALGRYRTAIIARARP